VPSPAQPVKEWLEGLGMVQYAEKLRMLGFDVVSTLAVLTEEDLIAADVTLRPHRHTLLMHAKDVARK
jgi:hypothetical protein